MEGAGGGGNIWYPGAQGPSHTTSVSEPRGHLSWQKGVAGAMAPQHWACGNYLGAGAWFNCFHPLKAWLSVFK